MRIARHNDRALYLFLLAAFCAGFAFFCSVLLPPFFHRPISTDFLYVIPFLQFLVVWYAIGLRLGIWRAFGVEEIVVDRAVLHWTRTALWWRRTVEIPTADITEVKAVTPWHALSNRVELTALNRHAVIGDMLLRDETAEVAEQLKRAVGLR